MAQVWKVRLPPGVQAHQLGKAPPRLSEQEWIALGMVLGGLGTALGVFLIATKRQPEAYALGVAGAITTAFIGAAKFLGDDKP